MQSSLRLRYTSGTNWNCSFLILINKHRSHWDVIGPLRSQVTSFTHLPDISCWWNRTRSQCLGTHILCTEQNPHSTSLKCPKEKEDWCNRYSAIKLNFVAKSNRCQVHEHLCAEIGQGTKMMTFAAAFSLLGWKVAAAVPAFGSEGWSLSPPTCDWRTIRLGRTRLSAGQGGEHICSNRMQTNWTKYTEELFGGQDKKVSVAVTKAALVWAILMSQIISWYFAFMSQVGETGLHIRRMKRLRPPGVDMQTWKQENGVYNWKVIFLTKIRGRFFQGVYDQLKLLYSGPS